MFSNASSAGEYTSFFSVDELRLDAVKAASDRQPSALASVRCEVISLRIATALAVASSRLLALLAPKVLRFRP